MITQSNSIWSCRLICNKLIKHILVTIAFHNSLVQGHPQGPSQKKKKKKSDLLGRLIAFSFCSNIPLESERNLIKKLVYILSFSTYQSNDSLHLRVFTGRVWLG